MACEKEVEWKEKGSVCVVGVGVSVVLFGGARVNK
jgi:hypothetical protein